MFRTLRSFTRLAIGGALLSYKGLKNQLTIWEQEVEESEGLLPSGEDVSTLTIEGTDFLEQGIPHTSKHESDVDLLGYLFVGITFQAQDYLEKRIKKVERASRSLGKLTNQIFNPILSSRSINPLRSQFNRLVVRGEEEVKRLVEIGRAEAEHSQALLKNAYHERLDTSIEYLANDPQIEELVTSQGASLVDEMIEEVRERTVSADSFLEGVVRSMLRLPLRIELPPPPRELLKHAIPSRVTKKRMIYK